MFDALYNLWKDLDESVGGMLITSSEGGLRLSKELCTDLHFGVAKEELLGVHADKNTSEETYSITNDRLEARISKYLHSEMEMVLDARFTMVARLQCSLKQHPNRTTVPFETW